MLENTIEKLPWYKKIVILRTAKGWSQHEAAIRCFTNQKVFWLWENGKSYPRKNSQLAIAKAFGVPVEEIFGNEPKPKIEKNKVSPSGGIA